MSAKQAAMGPKQKKRDLFKSGFTSGLGWAFGVTIGFALVATIMVLVLNRIDTSPWIGDTMADIIEATQEQLLKRSIISPGTIEFQTN